MKTFARALILAAAATAAFSVLPSLSQNYDPDRAATTEEAAQLEDMISACRETKDELEGAERNLARLFGLYGDTEVENELKILVDAEQVVGRFHTKFYADQCDKRPYVK
jgi:hypothetical protein